MCLRNGLKEGSSLPAGILPNGPIYPFWKLKRVSGTLFRCKRPSQHPSVEDIQTSVNINMSVYQVFFLCIFQSSLQSVGFRIRSGSYSPLRCSFKERRRDWRNSDRDWRDQCDPRSSQIWCFRCWKTWSKGFNACEYPQLLIRS